MNFFLILFFNGKDLLYKHSKYSIPIYLLKGYKNKVDINALPTPLPKS